MAEQLLILPPIILGLTIGLYEAILIHRDVAVPTHRFAHMAHALFLAVLAVFITMNTAFVIKLVGIPQIGFPGGTVLLVQIIAGLFMMFKIHAVSNVLQGAGMSTAGTAETWTHSLVVAIFIIAAPYAWPYIATIFPSWMQG